MNPDVDVEQDGQVVELLRLLELQSREVAELRQQVEVLTRAVADISASNRTKAATPEVFELVAAAMKVAALAAR